MKDQKFGNQKRKRKDKSERVGERRGSSLQVFGGLSFAWTFRGYVSSQRTLQCGPASPLKGRKSVSSK